jgi:type IV secretory pathway VirD2 relaxase
LNAMKIPDTQLLIVRHQDTEHPHLHIIYNRVDDNGKTIPDNFQHQRSARVCRALTEKHGFYIATGKERVKRQQLNGADKVKYQIHDAIKAALVNT